jgi:hypothetical protein
MKSFLISCICILLAWAICDAQGCVAIRNLSGFGQFASLGYSENQKQWLLDINNRYFEAHTLYQGAKDVSPADPSNGLSIYEYSMNFELSRILKNGWSLAVDLPISSNTFVSRLEHASGDRHSTHSFGIGDLRFTAFKWLLSSDHAHKGNIQLGAGLKFPTGNYHSTDYFYYSKSDPTLKIVGPVNGAIQLGDGGTGITTELNAFYIFNKTFSVFTELFYLISPVNQNGVSSQVNGVPPNPAAVEAGSDVNSVPDNYTLRAGANITFDRWVATAGLRFEGVPAHDLFGENDGLRHAGYIFSVEPGIQYKFKSSFLYCEVTLPVKRATIQTVPDKRVSEITGKYYITGGDFANVVFFVGYAFTF